MIRKDTDFLIPPDKGRDVNRCKSVLASWFGCGRHCDMVWVGRLSGGAWSCGGNAWDLVVCGTWCSVGWKATRGLWSCGGYALNLVVCGVMMRCGLVRCQWSLGLVPERIVRRQIFDKIKDHWHLTNPHRITTPHTTKFRAYPPQDQRPLVAIDTGTGIGENRQASNFRQDQCRLPFRNLWLTILLTYLGSKSGPKNFEAKFMFGWKRTF